MRVRAVATTSIIAVTVILRAQVGAAPPSWRQDARGASLEMQNVSLGVGGAMPAVKQAIVPAYPSDAAGIQGSVEVELVVSTRGDVLHARVSNSPDNFGVLDRVALEAARAWRFKPATAPDGRPFPALVALRFDFPRSTSGTETPKVTARMSAVTMAPLPARDAANRVDGQAPKAPGLQMPRPVRAIKPRYTEDAMRAVAQGSVVVDVMILADGTVGDAWVTRRLHPDLDQQALIAARYWFFEPARLEGRAVPFKGQRRTVVFPAVNVNTAVAGAPRKGG